MASLEKYRWQNSGADSSFDRATSLPEGISEIHQLEPYLPRAVRRISSDEDVLRYKDLFNVAQRNQGLTWKEYLGILRDDLCQFYAQDLETKALKRRLASSRNFENLHNTKSELKLFKTQVSRFKIGKRNLPIMTPIVEDSESMSSMEYANASKTSFMKSSRRLADPQKEKTSHYATALESKFCLRRKVTRNPSFAETEYTEDTDSMFSMEFSDISKTSFVELSRRLASPRKARTSHYVTASELEFPRSRHKKVTRNPSFVETECTGDTDSMFSMEFSDTSKTSSVELSRRLTRHGKARTSHYVTASELEFPRSRHKKVTRNPSFVETEYTGDDTDSVFSMEFGFGNTNNASYEELSRRLASPRKSETSHYVTASESKVSLSGYQVSRSPSFAKTGKVGDADSVCSMPCISTNRSAPTEDISMKRRNVSFSPQKNFLKKFGSGIRQFASKTKITVEKLSKYCSNLYSTYQNNACNMRTYKRCSHSDLELLDFNKPLTPDMLRVSPSRTISKTPATPNGYYEYTVNPQFPEKVKPPFKKKACTKRMLPFTT